jgi:DNA topoisomerase VI subunit B
VPLPRGGVDPPDYDESSDVSFKVVNEEIDWRRYHVPDEAPVAVITHICSTKIPYKTVGKEYIADRSEIEAEVRNAVREASRRLSLFLSKKGSLEAVQRKMNIYGKYLPLMARFSTELAGHKKEPRYKQLLRDIEEEPVKAQAEEAIDQVAEVEGEVQVEVAKPAEPAEAGAVAGSIVVVKNGENVIEQSTIEDYR